MLSTYLSIINAVEKGDTEYIELIARCIDMADAAKQILRDKGYGWTGLDLLQTCELVPKNEE